MNQSLKSIVISLLFVLVSCKSMAQNYATHSVKSGETLESIAKQYKVTPYNILKLNKELNRGQGLRPNTIIIIPLYTKKTEPTVDSNATDVVKKINEKKVDAQEKPIRFRSHKVRKRETLYSIARRYNIKVDDIKRYNRELYSSRLRKNKVLKIPIYRRVKLDEDIINEEGFEIYTVAPKETRWSIAHKYGITIDSMLVLNPELSKITNYLAKGQELKMPKIAGSSVQNQVTQLFVSYTVPPKMTLYSLGKKFDIDPNEIVRLNPVIAENSGLKEGMVIRIPEKKITTGEVNTDNYIFYEVKPKQNEFRLTRKFGMSWTEILQLNPDLKDGLKAGMILKLPKNQKGDFEIRNALVLDKINLLDSINVYNKPKLLFLLPFRLDKIDVNSSVDTKKIIQKRTDIKLSLGFYSGALIAIDSIAKLGVSVDVKTFDNQLSLDKTKEILSNEKLSDISAIIGPLDEPSLREVAIRASSFQVPILAPITSKTDVSLKNVFFSYTSDTVLREHILNHVFEKRTNQNIIIIADFKNTNAKDIILSKFPEAKIAEVLEEEKNIGVNRKKLGELLSEDTDNWVFVESDNFKLISSVTSILNSFNNSLLDPEKSKEKVVIKMFTTNKNKGFDNDVISGSHLSKLNFTYPSVYREVSNNSFVKSYRKRFGDTPDKYAVRGFDMTYDLLLKLAYKNNLVEVSQLIGETEYSGSKFFYEKDFTSGFFNQASYIMTYDQMRLKEVKE